MRVIYMPEVYDIGVEAAVMVVAVGYDEDPTLPVAAGRFPMPFPFVDGEVFLHGPVHVGGSVGGVPRTFRQPWWSRRDRCVEAS